MSVLWWPDRYFDCCNCFLTQYKVLYHMLFQKHEKWSLPVLIAIHFQACFFLRKWFIIPLGLPGCCFIYLQLYFHPCFVLSSPSLVCPVQAVNLLRISSFTRLLSDSFVIIPSLPGLSVSWWHQSTSTKLQLCFGGLLLTQDLLHILFHFLPFFKTKPKRLVYYCFLSSLIFPSVIHHLFQSEFYSPNSTGIA